MAHKKVPEDIQHLLKTVVDDCDKEDRAVRERQIRTWRRLALLWEGFSRVWYSEVAHDWRIWEETQDENTDQSYYDKPINVFRAYLESIIAALSVTVPPIKCFPDDAENPLDLATAKAGDKISQLIFRHNNAPLLWLHALFVFVTQGMIACYSYPKKSKEYGTYEEKEYEDVIGEKEQVVCSNCGFVMDERTTEISEELEKQEMDEFQPDETDVELHYLLNQGKELCPACMGLMDPHILKDKFITTRLVGITNQPKTRVCLEAYGGLNVKVPNYIRTQQEAIYLIYSFEEHYAKVIEDLGLDRDEIHLDKIKTGNNPGSYDGYDQWGRLSPQYQGEYPINVVTVKHAWLRPAAFNVLDEEGCKKLKKKYPDGAKVTLVNDCFICAENESLDDCWTLTYNPMSNYIHHDPLGLLLTSIQEITNDLISLIDQTIEHGISLTFADPTVLNFKGFEQTEVVPGGVFPATPKSGKTLADGFFQLKTSTLSGEVLPFFQQVQSLGQLTSGALPSIFGGQLEGSETASEYSMSRAQAQQRLQNVWKVLTMWWKDIFGKVVPMYIQEVQEDERDVQRNKDGSFINVFIRKAELEGKIGKVELEANENIPLTWAQKKDVIEKILANANPEVLKIVAAPENLPLLHEAMGLDELVVPGEDDVIKQYDEIKLLLNSEPIATMDPMMPEMPSVEIDPDYDNHAVQSDVVRKWVISEAGRQAKTDNPAGYKNVLLHGKMHLMIMQQQMQQQMLMASQAQGAPPEKPNPLTQKEAPITGEGDVSTIQ